MFVFGFIFGTVFGGTIMFYRTIGKINRKLDKAFLEEYGVLPNNKAKTKIK